MKRYLHLPESEYREIDALSASGMVSILRSPAHFAWSKTHPKSTPEMLKGTAIHRAVFEPARFDSCYTCAPCSDGRTKEYKAAQEAASSAGKILLKPQDYEDCHDIRKAIYDNELAASLLSEEGTAETSFTWEMETDRGLCPLKARLDFVGGRGIVDLKTVEDARPEAFTRHAFSMRYDVQAAFYTQTLEEWQTASGIEAPVGPFWWIVVERDAPYGVMVYTASEETLRWGGQGVQEAIYLYQKSVNRGYWAAYEQSAAHTLAPPSWWIKQQAERR